MTDIINVNAGVLGLTEEERNKRAQLAVKKFRTMQHGLTGFARALTGKSDVRVQLDTGTPRTDGKNIYFRPPLELGNPVSHDRTLCDKRDDSYLQRCPACRSHEAVMSVIFHEISHIAFDSFSPTTEHHKVAVTQRAIDEWGTRYAERIRETVNNAPAWMTNDYKGLAGLVSPFMPQILNALDDARVNASMFRARPGVRNMLRAHVHSLLDNGVEQADGSILQWSDAPLNAQVMVGTFVISAGYELRDNWFHPDVTAALRDGKLVELCQAARDARLVGEVYELTFKVLARLRELGYCKSEADPEDEPDDTPDDNDESEDGDEAQDEGDPDDGSDDGAADEDEAGEEGDGQPDAPAADEAEAGPEAGPGEGDADLDADQPDGDGAGEGAGEGEADGPVEAPEEEPAGDPEDAGSGGGAGDGAGEPDGGGDEGFSGIDHAADPTESDERDGDGPGDGGDLGDDEPGGEGGVPGEQEDASEGEPAGHEPSDDDLGGGQQPSDDGDEAGDPAGEPDGPGVGDDPADEGDSSDVPADSPDGDDAGASDEAPTPDEGDLGAGEGSSGDEGQPGSDEDDDADGASDESAPGDGRDGAGDPAGRSEADDQEVTDDSAEAGEGGVSDQDGVPPEPEGSGDVREGSGDSDAPAAGQAESDAGEPDPTDDGPADDEAEGDDALRGSGEVQGDDADRGEGTGSTDSVTEGGDTFGTPTEASDDDAPEPDDDADPFDMGADPGMGGTEIIEDDEPEPDMGTPEEVEAMLRLIENHAEPPKSIEQEKADEALDRAIIQGMYFETPSDEIDGVRVHREGSQEVPIGWQFDVLRDSGISLHEAGIEADLDIPEALLGPALLHTRRVFQDNQMGSYQNNLRAGRVNQRVLGRRAWSNDDRLFGKKVLPGKRDYFVLIGLDVSLSTLGENLVLIKRAAMAQAELLSRAGIPFAVYAHSMSNKDGSPLIAGGTYMDIFEIKTHDQPWDDVSKSRLERIGPVGGNLDGHTLEFYRRRLDEVDATDKVLLYYTDGRMPASNHDEELEVLQREIKTCRAKGYTLMGVGIRTDSPIRHGLDTVRVDNDEDIRGVVKHLEKRLAR